MRACLTILILTLAFDVHAAQPFALTEVAPGIFVHQGSNEARSAANLGDQANIGMIVGSRCTAVIDTGGSLRLGMRFREAIGRITDTPICYVINTHVHPDHMFGNAAFTGDKPVFIGHQRLAGAMATRADNYLRSLRRDLGEAADGSEIIPPQQTVGDRLDLDLGGRIITIRAAPAAHTDDDLTVWDARESVLWLSDLLFVDHVPALDGSIKGWVALGNELASIPARLVVPGHGPVSVPWPGAIAAQQRYLMTVMQGVRAAIKSDQTIQQAIDSVGWDEQTRWQRFEDFHRRTVTSAYAELEWEE